jgi:hypothetical protein
MAEKSFVNELIPMVDGWTEVLLGAAVVEVDVFVPLLPHAARMRLPATAVATPIVRFLAMLSPWC